MVELFTLGFVIVVSFGLGLFIYHNNPVSATNRTYSIFALAIIFWSTVMYLSLHPPISSSMLFFIRLSMVAAIFLTTSALLLAATFPNEKFPLKKSKLYLVLSISIAGIIVSMSPYLFTELKIENGNIEPIPGPGMIVFMVPGMGYAFLSVIILIRKYRKSTGIQRKQLGMVLTGLSLMMGLLIGANFLLVVIFKSSSLIFLGPLFTLTFLGATAYAITRHRLLDIRVLVARTVSFTLLTLVIVGIYAASLFSVLSLVTESAHSLASIALAVLLAFTFNPLKKLIEKITKNIFYKETYNSDTLLETLGAILRSTIALRYLTKNTLSTLSQTLHITQACFVINQEAGRGPLLIFSGYREKPYFSDNTLHDLAVAKNEVLIFEDLEESAVKMLMRNHHIAVVIPLRVKSTNHGLLLLGDKSSGEVYSQQDIDVLEIFAPQISLAVQNAKSFEEISRFNITLREEVAHATHDLKQANRHLKHLDKLKDEFVFIATHELKNPVTAMRGYLSLLQEGTFGKIPAKMQDPVDQLQASNQQLVDLVNDLLQIARAEAKSVTVRVEPVAICEIVSEVIGSVKPLADQKKININHVCPIQDLKVMADAQRFKEIINNLVSNAIKYSNKGSVNITHSIERETVTTNVTDQGVGIPKKDQGKIFTRFFRVEEEAAKGIPGTGLGLFIVKQLVEKMGGQIWFDSEAGIGTTFHFTLPKAD